MSENKRDMGGSMHYEINISEALRPNDENSPYVHLFATHERSLIGENEAMRVYNMLKEHFREPQFHIDITRWETIGTKVEF